MMQQLGVTPSGGLVLGKLAEAARVYEDARQVVEQVTVRPKPMRIWYDCEFVEDGRTIDLLSIGMLSEDGRELYRINGDYATMQRAVERDWLRENVVKHLPVEVWPVDHAPGWLFQWDTEHPDWDDVRDRDRIRDDVRTFVEECLAADGYEDVRLWAWYGAYDHVAYAQLFGKMVDLPEGFPMWTNDLRQEVDRRGNPKLPDLPNRLEHDAFTDAMEVKYRHLWLDRMV